MKSGSQFYSYKDLFSILLFALVNANYNILFVDVGYQGRISDRGVFADTEMYKQLEANSLNLPQPKTFSQWFNKMHSVFYLRR
jgi:hypothetical protein